MAKPEMKKTLQTVRRRAEASCYMTGQWHVRRFAGRVHRRAASRAARLIFGRGRWSVKSLLEACDVLEESFTARRSLLFNNPGVTDGRHDAYALDGHSDDQARRDRLGASSHIGGDSFRHQRRRQGVHRGQRREVSDGAQRFDSDAAVDLARSSESDQGDARCGSMSSTCRSCSVSTSRFTSPIRATKCKRCATSRASICNSAPALVRPTWENSQKENLPLRYAWKDIEPQLRALADQPGSPYDGVALEYVNPMTGGPTLPTLSCWIQLLRPGEHTKKHRHTSSAVYFVVGGEGTTIVGDKALEWTKNDCFAVPNWAWHEHVNRSKSEEALLFSVNDISDRQRLRPLPRGAGGFIEVDVDPRGAGSKIQITAVQYVPAVQPLRSVQTPTSSSPASRGRM